MRLVAFCSMQGNYALLGQWTQANVTRRALGQAVMHLSVTANRNSRKV